MKSIKPIVFFFEYIMNGNQKSMTYNKEIVNNANKVHHHITISQIKNECRQFLCFLNL